MQLFSRILPSAMLASAMLVGPAVAQDGDEDVIVVRGTLIPDEKKSTAEISSFLDAEDFERAGDSDIAEALRRVTGLSIQDGKFVIVRGLNERYSSATLNGSPLPSPEPLRRAAPLDLFPTSVIDSTLVQKTFSPQFSGEFGGGLVELRTKAIPDEDFAEFSLGFSANTETTFADGLFYEGSDGDVWGYDDGLRDIPGVSSALFAGSVDSATQNAIDTSFEQQDTLLITGDDVPGNGSGSIALGKRFYSEGDLSFGSVLYVGYNNDWQDRTGERSRDPGTNSSSSTFDLTRQNIGVSALSSTGLEFNSDHSLQLTALLVRNTLKQAEIENKSFTGDDREFLLEKTDFIERQLWQAQLSGEHLFPNLSDLGATWRVAYGEAERDQPYKRQTGYIKSEGADDFLFTVEEGVSNIDFRALKDENLSGGVDFTLPTDLFGTRTEFKFGGSYVDNSRTTSNRLFEFRGTFDPAILGSRADLIFSDENLGLDGPRLQFQSSRGEPDNFDGSLEVLGVYAGAEIELGPYVRASVGARYEESTQETETFLTRTPDDLSSFDPIEEDYILPAVTLTWNPVGNFQLRGGYSQTLTRPQFRELSPSVFTDPNTDQSYVGNPFLTNTEIDNFDIRAEMYFRRGEFATIGFFYKDLTNPIEDAIVTQGESVRTTFINAPSAELFGMEAEFEKNFDLEAFFENEFWYGKELVLKTNYTYSDSEVSNNGDVTVPSISGQGVTASVRDAAANVRDGSQLVGLSEHLFNFQLGIETEEDTKLTLAANYASERTIIRGEGTSGGNFLPAVVEQPPMTLDLILQTPISMWGGDTVFTFKVQNIMDSAYDAYYDDVDAIFGGGQPVYQAYDLGRTVAISAKRRF